MFSTFFLAVMGFSFGVLAAAGVFTVLIAVGLIPRFAGETHTGRYVLWYEEMVVFGTLFGGIISVYPEYCLFFIAWPQWLGNSILACFGLFCGMFVGCLALAIAEMLDSIPIFSRRVSLRHGIGMVILSVAIGKLAGSLFYFAKELWRTAG